MDVLKKAPVVIALSGLLLSACGGGDSDLLLSDAEQPTIPTPDADEDTNSQDSPIPTPSGNPNDFNGGMTGRLVFQNDKTGASQLDLSTGMVSTIAFADTPQKLLERNNLEPSDGAAFISTPKNSSAGYTYTLPRCQEKNPDAQILGVNVESCVFVYNRDLSVRRSVRTTGIELASPPLISPSGKYLFMNELTGSAGSGQSILYIADIDNDIDEFFMESDILDRVPDESSLSGLSTVRASALAWTPNDEMIYSINGPRVVIKVTEPASLAVAKTIKLPTSYAGQIESLDVSPDGSKLLIDYYPQSGVLESGVLLLDLVTLDISVPAIVPEEIGIVPLGDNIIGTIGKPRWSPDGQWIILTEGFNYLSIGFSATLGTYPAIFAVPANKQRTVLTTEQPTDAILISSENPLDRGNLVEHWSWSDNYYWTN